MQVFQHNHVICTTRVFPRLRVLSRKASNEYQLTKSVSLTVIAWYIISSQDLRVQSELRVWKPVFQPSCTKWHPTTITSLQDRKQVCKVIMLLKINGFVWNNSIDHSCVYRCHQKRFSLAAFFFSCFVVYSLLLCCLPFYVYFSEDGDCDHWMTFPWELLSAHMRGRF